MKIDLITGFLGAGKTTWIRRYAEYLIGKGEKICILENDYGAVNVDMMFLQDLLGDNCELEMVIGGDGYEAHRRRFKTKLISMAMTGYDRVLVEPSGIFDVDEFFDVLREEPLDRWYEPGNVIAVVDAHSPDSMSEESRYLLVSQIANAGCVVLSKVQLASRDEAQRTIALMNESMAQFHCSRRFGREVLAVDWEQLTEQDFDEITRCGYRLEDHIKYQVEQENAYKSLFYFYLHMDEQEIRSAVKALFADPNCGVRDKIEFSRSTSGQEAVIVIGEDLHKEAVDRYLVAHAVYHGEL